MSQRLAPLVAAGLALASVAYAQPPVVPPAGAPPGQAAAAPAAPLPHTSTGLPMDLTGLTPSDLPALLPVLDRLKIKMDDWPQLGRYQAANAQLAPAAAGDARVVFLGDSITDAWQNPKFGGFFPGKPYVDRGISGQTTPQMLLRMRADVIALKPKAMVLLAGTNDIAGNTGPMTPEQIQDNIATICELATLHGIKVVLSSILPTSNYHVKPGTNPQLVQTTRRPLAAIRALNLWMQAYAARNGHVYLDYFSAMIDSAGMLKAEFSEDDLHPNAAGYAVMAPLAELAIAKALSNK